MRMEVNKTGSDDQPAGVEYLEAVGRRDFPGRRNLSDSLAVQQNVERRVHSARRIDHPSILNEKHAMSPLYL